ncbi:MAG: hypothetical protein CML16_15385 [Pusillimonas sp.]|nr:hypothetical protein [Pusillimonas sp.]MBC41890.1 hypothetical protein [Pusillimonas sp.]HCP79187.1 hypothetical protein [Pusillimonas sp.]|tara:strand:+ start:796 stop:1041 length:246 start_codon:yes stop_codon:yes gene_type:complete
MQDHEYRRLIAQLQEVINDTVKTIDDFEAKGMNNDLPAEYEQLHAILQKATTDQRRYQHALLESIRNQSTENEPGRTDSEI